MCQLLETIRIADRRLINMAYHNERFNRSRRELFGITEELNLEDIVRLPGNLNIGTWKCRIVYDSTIHSIGFSPYTPRIVRSLQLVADDTIDYHYKYLDRTRFDHLRSQIQSDEILIVKNGFITDTSYSNIIFYDGEKWITPSSYLLNGTMRQFLLDTSRIVCDEIRPADICYFKSARLINAMLDMETGEAISNPGKNILPV